MAELASLTAIDHAYHIIASKLEGWLEAVVAHIPNLIAAAVVIAISVVLSRALGKLALRGTRHMDDAIAFGRLVATLVRGVAFVVGVFVALSLLGLDKTVTSLLAGAGVVGLVLGIAFQDLAANLIAGVFLSVRSPFQRGDLIQSGALTGFVRQLTMRSTELETFDGLTVFIPNRKVFENPLTNYTRTPCRRIELAVGVRYDADLEHVQQVATRALDALQSRDRSKPVDALAHEFGASSIDFLLRFWIQFPSTDYYQAISEAVIAVKRAFDEHGIEIPFPIRTLDGSLLSAQQVRTLEPARDADDDGARPVAQAS